MATTNLLPLANYPTGVREFGPFNTPNGINGVTLLISRCTTATPTIWPDTNSRIKIRVLRSFDGGNTYDPAELGGDWPGGIIVKKDGTEIAVQPVSFTSDPPPNAIKVTAEVINGPIRTKVDIVVP